jgi:hypothetical protein
MKQRRTGMFKPLIGVAHIFAVTALLIFGFGILSLGTFPLLGVVTTLWMALAITASAWFFYCVLGLAICAPLRIKSPGFALPTVLGTITGAAAILFVGWIFPANVLTHSFIAATPFALLNTLSVWFAAYRTGYLRSDLKLWPTR